MAIFARTAFRPRPVLKKHRPRRRRLINRDGHRYILLERALTKYPPRRGVPDLTVNGVTLMARSKKRRLWLDYLVYLAVRFGGRVRPDALDRAVVRAGSVSRLGDLQGRRAAPQGWHRQPGAGLWRPVQRTPSATRSCAESIATFA